MPDGAKCSVVDVNGCLSYDDNRFQQLLHLKSFPSHPTRHFQNDAEVSLPLLIQTNIKLQHVCGKDVLLENRNFY